MIPWNVRCTAVALLLAGTALLLQARATNQFVPPRTSLASFPVEFRSWVGTDIAIPDETLKSLGPGEYVQRIYQDQMTTEPYVTLYLAYLPNQHALFRHLPQDCLAGSGWSTVESGTTTLALPGDAPFPANRYLITRGSDRQLVLFWYSAHGRLIASENWVDFYLVFDSLRWNRSDNALIRMDTELRSGEKPDEAKRRLLAFADLVNPLLKNYIPR
jgi:EpsI family protein